MTRAILAMLIFPSLSAFAAEPPLPVPPIPPEEPPMTAAPVPDLTATEPDSGTTGPTVTLNMGIHRRDGRDPSLGFTPGSRHRVDDVRRPFSVPGLKLHVPLQ